MNDDAEVLMEKMCYDSCMHIGLIGLGTMGANLARNAARNGATVAIYNRTTEKMDTFIQRYGSEGHFIGCKTIEGLVSALPSPRAIVLMVNAGIAVDAVIEELKPFLHANDAIIDAGNSHFLDTERREKDLQNQGIHFFGMGVSGGEEGALLGPSMMPGGDRETYERMKPLFQKMAAKDGSGGKCVAHLGRGGAGHFVKMVHNGIEYGDMQLIAESYHLMKARGTSNADIGATFERWNRSRDLQSFLIEITASIFSKKDDVGTGKDLIDCIRDEAKQKGTGKWTSQAALDLGIMIPTITAAVDARYMSAKKSLRTAAASSFVRGNKPLTLTDGGIKDALFLSKICSYAQGLAMIAEADTIHGWGIDLAEVCRIWKGGCIIRSTLLETFRRAFTENPSLRNLILSPTISAIFTGKEKKWRRVIAKSILAGIPVPAMSASIAYFDSLTTASLPQNLTQAQRDFFGAHTYERTDRPGTFHTEWHTSN